MRKLINIFILLSLILHGCSITKRVYQPGYHIEWKNKKAIKSHSSQIERPITTSKEEINLSVLANEDNLTIQKPISVNNRTAFGVNENKAAPHTDILSKLHKKIERKITPKKVNKIIASGIKGVNLQEPSGQLFLLGILSLIFLGAGIALLYFITPPQINTGYLLLLLGTICLLTFFRILAGMFAEWAFG